MAQSFMKRSATGSIPCEILGLQAVEVCEIEIWRFLSSRYRGERQRHIRMPILAIPRQQRSLGAGMPALTGQKDTLNISFESSICSLAHGIDRTTSFTQE